MSTVLCLEIIGDNCSHSGDPNRLRVDRGSLGCIHSACTVYGGHCCHLECAAGGSEADVVDLSSGARTPELMKLLEKEFGKNITTRTWNTLQRIAELIEAHSG